MDFCHLGTSTPERSQLRNEVRRLARDKVVPEVESLDEPGVVWSLIEAYRDAGLYGVMVPPEYGGQGGDLTDLCIIAEELARADAVASIYLVTPMSCGQLYFVLSGNEEQKRAYLPRFAEGALAAMALTESGAGSDAGAISAVARYVDGGYVISGEKLYVSMGNVADYIVVFARTGPGEGNRGISAFVTERQSEGIEVGPEEKKMGFHAKPTVSVRFNDVVVDDQKRLGEEGQGFRIAMRMFNHSRVLQGALAVGLAQGALDQAKEYTRERYQFGRPVAANQGLRFMIADMQTRIHAARALTYEGATAVSEEGSNMRSVAAMAKYFASDVAMDVTTDAVQLMGGMGYMAAAGMEKKMRDAKLLQIFEGTNQILREVVARDVVGKLEYV